MQKLTSKKANERWQAPNNTLKIKKTSAMSLSETITDFKIRRIDNFCGSDVARFNSSRVGLIIVSE